MIIEEKYLEAKKIVKTYESEQLNKHSVNEQSEHLCQWHEWVKHSLHPKIGAMICRKCGTVLA